MILDFSKCETFSLPEEELPKLVPSGVRGASVIIPVFLNNQNQHSLILTKRNSKLKHHPGQISFPGGTLDSNESYLSAGLREWEEELGVSAKQLNVIGNYGHFHTLTGFTIFPFICIYNGSFQFNPNPEEVEKVIFLDLDEFQNKPFYCITNLKKSGKLIYYLHTQDELLWGATADIIVHLIQNLANFKRRPILVKPNLSYPPFLNLSNFEN